MRSKIAFRIGSGLVLAAVVIATTLFAQNRAGAALKLYVFDCGTIAPMDPTLYGLTQSHRRV